jgi:hypothetical protein
LILDFIVSYSGQINPTYWDISLNKIFGLISNWFTLFLNSSLILCLTIEMDASNFFSRGL